MTIYIDGSYKQNHNVMSTGVVIYGQEGEKIKEIRNDYSPSKKNSNNHAEYLALLTALDFVIKNNYESIIEIFTDSQLVANQMNGIYRVNKGKYLQTYYKCKEVFDQLSNVKITWISRKFNKEADGLAA